MRLLPCVGIAALVVQALALAGEPAAKDPAKREHQQYEHLDVWAETVDYNGKTARFVFTDNVTVIKADLRVDCDAMEGIIDPKTRQITAVTASGNVRMVSVAEVEVGPDGAPVTKAPTDAWRATCGIADYDLKGDRIVLKTAPGKERPRLWRGNGYGEADTIIFFPDKGEYELIGKPVIRGILPTGPAKGAPEALGPPAKP